MKLMTKALEKRFEKFPLYSQEGKSEDETVVVAKFFNPCGAGTWLITEGSLEEDGDWLLFGIVNLGYGWEWGNVLLSELASLKGPFGLGIERDLYLPTGMTVGEYLRRYDNA